MLPLPIPPREFGLDAFLVSRYDGNIVKVRIQISLSAEVHTRVHRRAADLGISLAEYMRRLVDQDLSRSPGNTDRSLVFDLGSSKRMNIASEKSRMIAEAIGARKRRDSESS